MKNEKILIFGDSYSTFKDWIPEGYESFYPRGEVVSLEQTWWHMLLKETDSELVQNNSWSGSTICNTGYHGDCSKTNSFICRLGKLIDKGFFEQNEVDRVFVFGGTNDAWSLNARGELIFENWTEEDKKLILPGISFFVHKLIEAVGKDKVHIIINSIFGPTLKNGFLEICEHYGVSYTALVDIDMGSGGGHPNANGMTQIKDQVLANLR